MTSPLYRPNCRAWNVTHDRKLKSLRTKSKISQKGGEDDDMNVLKPQEEDGEVQRSRSVKERRLEVGGNRRKDGHEKNS